MVKKWSTRSVTKPNTYTFTATLLENLITHFLTLTDMWHFVTIFAWFGLILLLSLMWLITGSPGARGSSVMIGCVRPRLPAGREITTPTLQTADTWALLTILASHWSPAHNAGLWLVTALVTPGPPRIRGHGKYGHTEVHPHLVPDTDIIGRSVLPGSSTISLLMCVF